MTTQQWEARETLWEILKYGQGFTRGQVANKIFAWYEAHSPRVPTREEIHEILMVHDVYRKCFLESSNFEEARKEIALLEDDLLALFSPPKQKVCQCKFDESKTCPSCNLPIPVERPKE